MKWPTVSIKDVARIVGGATPRSEVSEYWGGSIKWTTPKDLSNLGGKFISDTPRKITELGLKNCSAEMLPANSVLFSSRAPIGHVAINTVPMSTNQGFKSFVPSARLDASFLYWWLDTNRLKLQEMGTGATFKEVSKAAVERIEIPLPPLDEQKRIAAILDQADALRRLRTRALDRLNALAQAIFHEMFGDVAKNSKGFPMGTVGDLAANTQYGTSEKAGETGAFPVLRMNNLTYDGRMDLSSLKYMDLKDRDVAKHTVVSGDMLFNRTNSPELVGKTAVYRGQTPVAFAGYLVRLRPNADGNTDYISAVLNSAYGKSTLRGMCKSIIGMANINAKELCKIRLPLPPRHMQDAFAERLAKVEMVRPSFDVAIAESTALFTSLQHRAFRGEL